MRIRVVTYNLAQQQPSEAAIRALVAPDHHQQQPGDEDKPFDVLVVGVEEHTPFLDAMRTSTLHTTSGNGENSDALLSPNLLRLVQGIDRELTPQAKRIAAAEHGAVGIAVWMRSTCPHPISVVSLAKVGIGLTAMSNKSAAGVVLAIGAGSGQTVTSAFVCAHLAAGTHSTRLRNSNFRDIVSRLLFPGLPGLTLFHCDAAFVLGDLNYRAPPPLPRSYQRSVGEAAGGSPHELGAAPEDAGSPTNPGATIYLQERDWRKRLESDQLQKEMMCGRTLPGFTEPAIHFPPTYKLDTSVTDAVNADAGACAGPYTGRRHPSWCDRIVFYTRTPSAVRSVKSWLAAAHSSERAQEPTAHLRGSPSGNDSAAEHNPPPITCMRYSTQNVAGSDHLPVAGTFDVNVERLYDICQQPAASLPDFVDQYWMYSRLYWQLFGVAADRIAGTAYTALTDTTSLSVCIAVLASMVGYYCVFGPTGG
ncbi:DNase I-like protein [Martensiomyces pterosporus]|nr:DNase I-like protein [Martensiomyces pterosporus]